ncbi:hypothetical protein Micbo1qcDRAFT_203240 [Microdochium bolleyi]|uniref:Uncharacterized protein n=1 Tax=Microdochium bolleyi TaxID=196109 RepID=A0A136J7H3_9PEZI|nr:hypothetical protein Micbo1qcDRAFT_203240 [Microdochium bolleyi]
MAERPPPNMRPPTNRGVQPRSNLSHQRHHHSSSNGSNHHSNSNNNTGAGVGAAATATAAPLPPPPTATTTTITTNSGVRRNLFQSQLTRRPTPTSTGSAETLRLGDNNVDVLSDTSEIVVRDKNGDFEIGDPPTPPLEDPEDGGLDEAQENEQERRRLADAVKHHQINLSRMPAQPEEVMEILRASMRAQVASLAEDNWMYEAEEQSHLQ